MKGSFPPKGAVEALEQLGGFAGPCFTWIRAGGPGERQQRSQDFPCEHGQQKAAWQGCSFPNPRRGCALVAILGSRLADPRAQPCLPQPEIPSNFSAQLRVSWDGLRLPPTRALLSLAGFTGFQLPHTSRSLILAPLPALERLRAPGSLTCVQALSGTRPSR